MFQCMVLIIGSLQILCFNSSALATAIHLTDTKLFISSTSLLPDFLLFQISEGRLIGQALLQALPPLFQKLLQKVPVRITHSDLSQRNQKLLNIRIKMLKISPCENPNSRGEHLTVEPLCGTSTLNCGTFMWNLVEPELLTVEPCGT